VAFERLIPLRKPSGMAQRDIVQFRLGVSNGVTGVVTLPLNEVAELAIRDRTEKVSLVHLDKVQYEAQALSRGWAWRAASNAQP